MQHTSHGLNLTKANSKLWLRILAYTASSKKNNNFMEKQDKGKQVQTSGAENGRKVNIWEEINGVSFSCRFF